MLPSRPLQTAKRKRNGEEPDHAPQRTRQIVHVSRERPGDSRRRASPRAAARRRTRRRAPARRRGRQRRGRRHRPEARAAPSGRAGFGDRLHLEDPRRAGDAEPHQSQRQGPERRSGAGRLFAVRGGLLHPRPRLLGRRIELRAFGRHRNQRRLSDAQFRRADGFLRHRLGRSAARTAGHALRPQHDRRPRQPPHQAPGRHVQRRLPGLARRSRPARGEGRGELPDHRHLRGPHLAALQEL